MLGRLDLRFGDVGKLHRQDDLDAFFDTPDNPFRDRTWRLLRNFRGSLNREGELAGPGR